MPYDASFNGMVSMVVIMLSLTTTTLALRLIARYKQKKPFGADDGFAILAWLTFVGTIAVAIYGISIHYLGFSTPSNHALVTAVKVTITQALLSGLLLDILTLGFGRLSAVFFFRRIFCTGRTDLFDIVTKIMIAILSLWTVGFFLSSLLSCGSNIAGWWGSNSIQVCIIYPNQEGIAASSFILDLLVLILPLPKIWSLHTTGARKLALSIVFLMALLGVIGSCIRMVIVFMTEDKGAAVNNLDPFQANTRNYFYQLLEAGSCMIVINLPSIWYFIRGVNPDKLLKSVVSLVSLRSTSPEPVSEKNSFGSQRTESMVSSSKGEVPSNRAYHELEAPQK